MTLWLERLEAREMLSANSLVPSQHPSGLIVQPAAAPATILNINSPATIRTAYGLTSLPNQGQGMTVAIVDAFTDPNITSDLSLFSSLQGLPQMNGVGGNPTFQVLVPTGQATPPNSPPNDWAIEISLDVEYVHAIAPFANIDLVTTQNNSGDSLFAAEVDGQPYQSGVFFASHLPGVVVVSNSYGGGEFNGENAYDAEFTTNPNVAYTFSTGDNGAPGGYPAFSPNVLAVGGTSLYTRGAKGTYGSEIGWSGSGGGVSQFEPTPAYQSNNGVNFGARATPDVSMDADPNTGVLVIDQYDFPGHYILVGGTSLAAPMWAGLIALGDQTRIGGGGAALNNSTIQNAVYGTYNSANYLNVFHDETSGNNGFAAGPGYDLVTGIGSPKAQVLVPLLAGATPAVAVSPLGSLPGGSNNGPAVRKNVTIATAAQMALPASMTSQSMAATTFSGQAAARFLFGGSAATVSVPAAASQTVRSDPAFATALPYRATSNVEGFHETVDAANAADLAGDPADSGAGDISGDDIATTAAIFNRVEPAVVARNVSDVVFADIVSETASDNRSGVPTAVLAGEESQPIDFAMMAGLALALGGSWSGFARSQENRKVPALRNN
jgi:hypothetical protein